MSAIDPDLRPTELRVSKDRATLGITFSNGAHFEVSAEFLRVESPSAEVQGHSPDEKQIVPGKRNVKIRDIEPVGNYAVRLIFDDGHDTGLYSWSYLTTLGLEHERLWQDYLTALDSQGLKRDPL